jgi:hypothetical protein
MIEYIPYVALGVSALSLGINFIVSSKLSKIQKALAEEIDTRAKKDDKLYYLLDSKFKVAMGMPTNYEQKQRQQQTMQQPRQQEAFQKYPGNNRNFDELIEGGQEHGL